MRRIIIVMLLALIGKNGFCQIKKDSLTVGISGMVDTTDVEVKQVFELFKNYIESRPDSAYDNPYWNKEEKVLNAPGNSSIFYKGFYSLEMSPKEIFSYWKPFILNITKKNETKYFLRIALVKDSNDYSKFLTILNVNAIKENEKWVLQNVLQDISDSWYLTRYKYLKFYYPKTHKFNDSLAQKSIAFCDSIANLLQIKSIDSINFFICDNPDEMGLLLGYEFYYVNYTTGLTNKSLNQIFSAKGNEYYPHEFVHMILDKKNENRNYIIEEGLACFFGERNTTKYKKQNSQLANDYLKNATSYTLFNLLSNKAIYNNYQTAYPVGSVVAEIVFKMKGYKGLKELSDSDNKTPELIYYSIKRITGLNSKQFEIEFRKMLLKLTEN